MKDVAALDDALRGQPHLRPLTTREIEVMDYVVQGLSNQEIAAALGMARTTVNSHLRVIRDKLHIVSSDRPALIALYLGYTRDTTVAPQPKPERLYDT